MDPAIAQYRECWRRIIFDATGDNAKALRALELADINGMFDPIRHAKALRKAIAISDHDPGADPVLACRCGWCGKQYALLQSWDASLHCPKCGADFVSWPQNASAEETHQRLRQGHSNAYPEQR